MCAAAGPHLKAIANTRFSMSNAATRRIFGLDLKVEFAGDDAMSAVLPAMAYMGVRTLAKLMTALLPMSSIMAFLTTLIWLAAAFYLFFVVTWQRDDSWLAAGIIIASTILCGGLVAEVIGRLFGQGSPGDAAVALLTESIGMVIRAIILVPLAGGAVAGARWLTTEIRRSDALS